MLNVNIILINNVPCPSKPDNAYNMHMFDLII